MATKKEIYPAVIERVTRLYPAILRRCAEQLPLKRSELTIFDVVHDTVLRIIHDKHAAAIDTDREFVEYFLFRTNAVIFKHTHDQKLLHKAYAEYKQSLQENYASHQ